MCSAAHLALNYNKDLQPWLLECSGGVIFPLQNAHTLNHWVKRLWVLPSSHIRAPRLSVLVFLPKFMNIFGMEERILCSALPSSMQLFLLPPTLLVSASERVLTMGSCQIIQINYLFGSKFGLEIQWYRHSREVSNFFLLMCAWIICFDLWFVFVTTFTRNVFYHNQIEVIACFHSAFLTIKIFLKSICIAASKMHWKNIYIPHRWQNFHSLDWHDRIG